MGSISTKSQSISNSAYNIFGIGSLERTGLTAYGGMGYAALGSRPTDMVNLKNPASLSSPRGATHIFDTGLTFSQLSQRSNEASSSSFSGGLNDLSMWFRTSTRTGLAIGLEKFSDASYDILDSRSGDNNIGGDDSRHLGSGGSSQIFVAGAYSPWLNLHLGIKANFLFASLTRSEVLSISQPATDLRIENSRSFNRPSLESGIQYQFFLNDARSLTLGGTFRTGGNTIVANEQIIIGDTGFAVDSLLFEENTTIYLPRKMGFGIGFRSRSWEVNVDYEFEDWGQNKPESGFDFNDRQDLSFGAQYVKDRYGNKLFERIALRFGGGVNSSYVVVDGIDFISQYYTAGLGIPLNRSQATLNLTYQYHYTNPLNAQLITEGSNNFSFSIIIRDLWFSKRAFD